MDNVLKQCPLCKEWDVLWAITEDGGYGDWCQHCNRSVIPEAIKSNLKKCPLCSEHIPIDVIKCPHCDELLVPPIEFNKALKDIRSTYKVGFLLGGLHLLGFFAAPSTISPMIISDKFEVLWMIALFVLSYGIYKRSRICVILLLSMSILIIGINTWLFLTIAYSNKIFLIVTFILLVIILIIIKGLKGIFIYHKILMDYRNISKLGVL